MIFVRLDSSSRHVLEYSQERMAKNVAPMQSLEMALSLADNAWESRYRSTVSGRAFCCFTLGSRFL